MIQIDPENKFTPLPEYLEHYRTEISNFGLYFQKFGKYQQDRDGNLKIQHTWNRNQKEWSLLSNQLDQYKKMNSLSSMALTKKHKNQQEYLSAFSELGSGISDIVELSAKNSTRFLVGIGETTPTEVGMVFDRNMGVPYIPASSIKGAVRYAYCVNFVRNNTEKVNNGQSIEEEDVNGLIELFGSLNTNNSSRGGFSFMDTFSEQAPEIVMDIMNPHHGKYYKGENNDGPVEIEEPVPIKFLSVEKGGRFKFRGFFLNKKASEYREELTSAFVTAITEIGLGAKTAIGYGRFEKPEDTTATMLDIIQKRKKVEIEIIKLEIKKAEEIKRKAELAAMSPEEKEMAAFDDGHITTEKVNVIYKKLDEYSDEDRPKFAQKLKNYWTVNKMWTKKEVGKKQWRNRIRERNEKIEKILGD